MAIVLGKFLGGSADGQILPVTNGAPEIKIPVMLPNGARKWEKGEIPLEYVPMVYETYRPTRYQYPDGSWGYEIVE